MYLTNAGKTSGNASCVVLGLTLLVLATFMQPQLFSYAQPSNNNGDNAIIGNDNQTEIIYSKDSSPFDLAYAQWTAKWWQWAYSIPKNTSPAYDDAGRHCAVNQGGPVWFIPGSYGMDVTRQCSVPAGKAILFPILNSECSFAEFPNLKSQVELRQCAREIQDSVIHLQADVDGKNITNLEKYRIQSPLFDFALPEDNILGLPPRNTQAGSDGNWVFLKPLPEGKHTISFKGDLRNASDAKTNSNYAFAVPYGWDNKVKYHLTVTGSTNPVS